MIGSCICADACSTPNIFFRFITNVNTFNEICTSEMSLQIAFNIDKKFNKPTATIHLIPPFLK